MFKHVYYISKHIVNIFKNNPFVYRQIYIWKKSYYEVY